VAFDPQSGRIDFHRAFAPGTRCSCPQCGAEHPPVHDTLERDWRHLNCFQFQASIHAKVPRVRCGTCAKTTPRSWRPGRAPTAASAYGWRSYWSPSVRRWRSLRSLNCLASATGASGAPSIITSIRRTLKRTSRPSPRLVSTRPPRGVDTMPSVCSMPAKGEKPGSWPSLPMRSRLMVPVPGTAARSVWICRQATRLACVSICPGRRSPSMSFTPFSSSTGRLTQCVAKKSKGPRSGGVHAISGSRTSTLGVTARKPSLRNSSAETSRHPERRHCSRNLKWGPSDVGCTKLGDGHGLRRPAFVLRPSRRALRAAPGLPQ